MSNRFEVFERNVPQTEQGQICTTREVLNGIRVVVSTSVEVTASQPPDHFLDVLREWGCTCMWHILQTEGDNDWIERAIKDDSLMAVTDGSFIRELYPELCSAAFILECTKGRGQLVGSFLEKSSVANA